MKTLLSSVFVCAIFTIYGQQPMNQKQVAEQKKNEVIQHYGIYPKDHRGLVIYFEDQKQIQYPIEATFKTLEEAFEFFFNGGLMKDLVCVQVLKPQGMYPAYAGGTPMDMNQSVEKFVELFKQ